MQFRFSSVINLGFLLGLAVVTSLTLPDSAVSNSPDELAEKLIAVPVETEHATADDKAPQNTKALAPLELASLPQPSALLRDQLMAALPRDDAAKAAAATPAPIAESAPDPVPEPVLESVPNPALEPMLKPVPQTVPQPVPEPRLHPVKGEALAALPHITPMVADQTPNQAPKPRQARATPPLTAALSPLLNAPLSRPNPAKRVLVDVAMASQQSPPRPVAPAAVDMAAARRTIEHGEDAPSLEFLWPANSASHRQIYHILTQCLGMIVGHIDQNGQVAVAPGQGVMLLNRAIHSPLLRAFNQPVTPKEARLVAGLRHHKGDGDFIRIFRKNTDVNLLAGFRKMTKDSGHMGQHHLRGQITAEYVLAHDGLFLDQVTHNGNPLDGRVQLFQGQCS